MIYLSNYLIQRPQFPLIGLLAVSPTPSPLLLFFFFLIRKKISPTDIQHPWHTKDAHLAVRLVTSNLIRVGDAAQKRKGSQTQATEPKTDPAPTVRSPT